MKKWNRLLNKFWFWVLLVFLGNIVFTGYGLIQSNKEFKNNNLINSISISSSYKPNKVGIFNNTYNEKLKDGKVINLNVKSIIYDDKKLIINVNYPNSKELSTYFNDFLDFKVLNKNGEEITPRQIDFIPGNISKFIISGDNLNKADWVSISPYKIEENDSLIFYVNKNY